MTEPLSHDDATARRESVPVMIKFGPEPYMTDLYERGVLYLRRLDHFQREEDADPLRFDRWEGIDVVLQPGRSHIKINGRRFELAAPGLMYLGGPPPPHVWCAYAVTAGRVRQNLATLGRAVEDQHVHWGSHAVVIHDVPEFLRRARQSFRSLSVGCSDGLVIYVPEHHEGELGPFRKRDTYSYQSEFRFVVRGWPDDGLCAEIGSLKDLSVLVTAKDAVSLEVRFDDE